MRINSRKELSFKETDFFVIASDGDCFSAFIIKNKKTGKQIYILRDGEKMENVE